MKPSRLFITGRKEISPNKGTTQEDLIAMGMCALGSMPLFTSIISNNTGNLIRVALPDDLTGVGKIQELIEWWKNVLNYGFYLGYCVNVSKSWLIMKEEYIEIANEAFQDYNIKITTDGEMRCSNENIEPEVLTNFAYPEPHAAFSGFIHGLRYRYTYFMRTISGISHLLKSLDDAIDIFIKVFQSN